jgi:hypothetical protein
MVRQGAFSSERFTCPTPWGSPVSEPIKSAVQGATLRLLDPLARLLLESGIGVGELHGLIKRAFVQAARRQFGPNASRIAIVTGLTRAEVASILASAEGESVGGERGRQRAERVLSGWWNDPDFQTDLGKPAILPVKGARRSFQALCARYNGEPRTAAILEELVRVRAVRRQADGRVEALSRTYATVRWEPEGIAALGEQIAEHCATLLHNLNQPSRPRFTRRVVNTQLDPRFAPLLIRDMEQQAAAFADAVDDALNDPQHTVKPAQAVGNAMRLGIGLYVFEEPAQEAPPVRASRKPKRKRRASHGR